MEAIREVPLGSETFTSFLVINVEYLVAQARLHRFHTGMSTVPSGRHMARVIVEQGR